MQAGSAVYRQQILCGLVISPFLDWLPNELGGLAELKEALRVGAAPTHPVKGRPRPSTS